MGGFGAAFLLWWLASPHRLGLALPPAEGRGMCNYKLVDNCLKGEVNAEKTGLPPVWLSEMRPDGYFSQTEHVPQNDLKHSLKLNVQGGEEVCD